MHRWTRPRQQGFTIVELLIVIVVIGILAAIVIVTFNGIQNRAVETAAKSDLRGAAKIMEITKTTDGLYPSTFPSEVRSSPGITLTLTESTLPYYAGLSSVQNGVLLSQICQDLINEGKGSGTNLGGGTDNYITGCGNWNHGSMQVTGWTSRVFSTPISDSTFTSYAAAVPAGDAWHPNQQTVIQGFYNELHTRLLSQGGSYPIASFWDSWASPTNGGVAYESLPASSSGVSGYSYCIQAEASGGRLWSIRQVGSPTTSSC